MGWLDWFWNLFRPTPLEQQIAEEVKRLDEPTKNLDDAVRREKERAHGQSPPS